MLEWSTLIDKVDPNVSIPCIPELTQGYVLQTTPDPFDRLKGIGHDGGTAVAAKEYLQQYAGYAELFTIVNRAFSVATLQEQYKVLKAFVTSGADVEALLESRNPDVTTVLLSTGPIKQVYGSGSESGSEGGYVVWVLGESKLCLVNSMTDVNKLLIQICKISEMKVDKLKQLGKLLGVPGAYKLKKAELIDSITALA
jgi:hypothetical protein